MGEKERAALLAQTRPKAIYPADILSAIEAPVKRDELKRAIEAAKLTPREVVEIVSALFPSFDKTMLSKCMKPQKYGVVLHPDGLAAIKDRAPSETVPEKGAVAMMTQCERILRHFKDYGSITSLEAMKEYGIMRLASRISDLRKMGYDIEVTTETSKNRYGEKTSYARYSLRGGKSSDE